MEKSIGTLKREYNKACFDYLNKLIGNWKLYEDDTPDYGWWIGDEVGTTYFFNEEISINMDDIRYCVNNDVDYQTYLNYNEYNTRCHEYGLNTITLKEYICHEGRVSDKELEKIAVIRKELDNFVDSLKNNTQTKK